MGVVPYKWMEGGEGMMEKRENRNKLMHRSISAKVIPVIEVKTVIGKGTDQDPVRCIREYWTFNGDLLAVNEED